MKRQASNNLPSKLNTWVFSSLCSIPSVYNIRKQEDIVLFAQSGKHK